MQETWSRTVCVEHVACVWMLTFALYLAATLPKQWHGTSMSDEVNRLGSPGSGLRPWQHSGGNIRGELTCAFHPDLLTPLRSNYLPLTLFRLQHHPKFR